MRPISPGLNQVAKGLTHDFYAYYRFNPSRDTPDNARNTLLVVGTLIRRDLPRNLPSRINPPAEFGKTKPRGWSPYTSVEGHRRFREGCVHNLSFLQHLSVFFFTQMITYLIIGCPFYLEVLIAIYSMSFTYGFSIAAVEPPGAVKSGYITIAFLLPYALRLSQQIFKKYKKRG
ncbi:hypothetical protein AAG906_040539 [Vitis piasezkii]